MGPAVQQTLGMPFHLFNNTSHFLELVPSLETDDFIMALRQFVCRGGSPVEIRTDRGTYFVGAARITFKIYQELQQKGVKWTLYPPTAAHMSGV